MFNTFGSGGTGLVGGDIDEMQQSFRQGGGNKAQVNTSDLKLMSPQELYLMAMRNPRIFDMYPWMQGAYHDLYEHTHPHASVGLKPTIH